MRASDISRRSIQVLLLFACAGLLLPVAFIAFPGQSFLVPKRAPKAAAFTASKEVFGVVPGTPFPVGSIISYSVIITNSGDTPTSGLITVTDALPAGLVFSSAGSPWNCTGTTNVTCSESSQVIDVGAPFALHLFALVTCSQGASANIFNTAVVSGGGTVGSVNATDPTAEHTIGNPPCAPPPPSPAPSDVPEADTVLLFGGGVGGLATWLGWQWRRVKHK